MKHVSRILVSPQEALTICEFQTSIGRTQDTSISCTLVVLGGEPESPQPDVIAEIVATFEAGGGLLILSHRADLRDRAKPEVVGMLSPVKGSA